MAITTLAQYFQSQKQEVLWTKTTARTTTGSAMFSTFDLAGNPAAGTLAGVNTANGVVPTSATTGYPAISSISGSNKLYLGDCVFNGTISGCISIYDRLFVAGAYAFNASTTLTAQPSFASRVPNSDYTQLELWVEQVTVASGNQAVTVTYTNVGGTSGRTTGAVGIGGAPTVGRCWQLPLQAGDNGLQLVESVTGTVAASGTFNVMVLRPLVKNYRIGLANVPSVLDPLAAGLREIYTTSALYVMYSADSTSTGAPNLRMNLANG